MAKKNRTTEVKPSVDIALVQNEDILGLGAAANSPAAKEIARGVIGNLFRPIGIYLEGKAEAAKIVALAKARNEAARLDAQTSEVFERARERFISQETRKQINLEQTVTRAIELANIAPVSNDEPKPIPPDWLLRWSEGAQYADDAQVQEFWARILAAKPSEEGGHVSPVVLSLLRDMDSHIAQLFVRFSCELAQIRTVAVDADFSATTLTYKDILLLEEVGLVQQYNPASLDFGWIDTKGSIGHFAWTHTAIGLTQRAHSLATALFGNHKLDELYPDVFQPMDVAGIIIEIILKLSAKDHHLAMLTFKGKDGVEPRTLGITWMPIQPEKWQEITAPIVRDYPELASFIERLGSEVATRPMPTSSR